MQNCEFSHSKCEGLPSKRQIRLLIHCPSSSPKPSNPEHYTLAVGCGQQLPQWCGSLMSTSQPRQGTITITRQGIERVETLLKNASKTDTLQAKDQYALCNCISWTLFLHLCPELNRVCVHMSMENDQWLMEPCYHGGGCSVTKVRKRRRSQRSCQYQCCALLILNLLQDRTL